MLRAERPGTRGMREAWQTRAWVDLPIVAALLLVLLTGFTTIVDGRSWWLGTAIVVGLVTLTCGVLRAVGRQRWVTPVALLVLGWSLCVVYVPETLVGPFPTARTVETLGSLLDRAYLIVWESEPPVVPARGITLLVAGAFGLLVVLADQLLSRRSGVVWFGLLALAVHVTPSAVSGRAPSALLFVLAAAIWLLLLRRNRRTATAESPWPSLIVGATALLAAVMVPPVLPDISAVAQSWRKPPPPVFATGVNPMLNLGQNLRRGATSVAFDYTTTLPDPPYLKVANLRDFDGRIWKPTFTRANDHLEGVALLEPEIVSTAGITDIRIRDLVSTMLPVPYPATGVVGLEGDWQWGRYGLTVTSDDTDTRRQHYRVSSLSIVSDADALRAQGTTPQGVFPDERTLPDDIPAVIGRTAREITAGLTNDHDRAMALQDFFRNGGFSYSETAPVVGGYDGSGARVVAEFLEVKSGYCIHFASAMALMAREVGIPARVAVGYTPGTVLRRNELAVVRRVTSDNLHAWPELVLPGAGWVSFEPTPGRGAETNFEPVVAPVPGDTDPQQGRSTAERPEDPLEAVDPTAKSSTLRTAVVAGGLGLVVLLAPGVVRTLVRRRRVRSGSPDALWREVESTAGDLGVVWSSASTPRGFAAVLADRPGTDVSSLDRVRDQVELARFARPGSPLEDVREDALRLVTSLEAATPRTRRWRARLLPRGWRR